MPTLSTGSARCQCPGCGEHFGGVGGFDAHQRLDAAGELRCLDPAAVGLVRTAAGWWPVIANGVGPGATGARTSTIPAPGAAPGFSRPRRAVTARSRP